MAAAVARNPSCSGAGASRRDDSKGESLPKRLQSSRAALGSREGRPAASRYPLRGIPAGIWGSSRERGPGSRARSKLRAAGSHRQARSASGRRVPAALATSDPSLRACRRSRVWPAVLRPRPLRAGAASRGSHGDGGCFPARGPAPSRPGCSGPLRRRQVPRAAGRRRRLQGVPKEERRRPLPVLSHQAVAEVAVGAREKGVPKVKKWQPLPVMSHQAVAEVAAGATEYGTHEREDLFMVDVTMWDDTEDQSVAKFRWPLEQRRMVHILESIICCL
ncbi:uncharacterized protein LOC123381382 [Felis catus]|uniref:uncharacterized protein LOC123381382 n=1 Tax=Felis catus TaxID=9685 RepID=UPI001D1A1A5A|nr:uncharacterized protein LOC123381382 [Felis catus]